MLENNNQAVITRMAKRSLKSNRRRSIIMILSIALSAFMLFSVLTVGVTYFKMQRLQNVRMNGADFDAILYGLTDEQRKMCEENPDITAAGIRANAGYVMSTARDSTPNVVLSWADDTYWNIMMKPARTWVKGEYPTKSDEIMVTQKALEECGMEDLGIGDSFEMEYGTPSGTETKEFRISGMWEGYGDKAIFYVSEEFYADSGYKLSDVASGRYQIRFESKLMTQKEQDAFVESMNLGKQQRLFFTVDTGYSVQLLIGIAGLILVTCFCAYLLIYNIMYLSVSGNIRYYGLLQTVGMTGRQVYRLVLRQMMHVAAIGITGGIFFGSIVSFFLIPATVHTLGIQSKQAGEIEVAFHPVIFLMTILLTGLTVYIGSRKPAKLAVRISPIEALGYRPVSGKKSSHKTGKGMLVWRMAREQITKDKKKSGLVILSLAAGMSVFLCFATLLASHGARTFVSNYMDMDMVIKNDTLKKEHREDWTQILDENFIADIRNNPGVKEVNPMLCTEIIVPWEPEFSDMWMREFYDMWMSIPYEDDKEEYQAHPENFGSFLVGIGENEFGYLNAVLEHPVDEKAFMSGKTCILYRDGLDFKDEDLKGKEVTCAEYSNAENTRTFQIAGLMDDSYYSGALSGYPPTIIVSDKVVESFVKEPFVYKTSVRYEEAYDEKTEADMIALMQKSTNHKDFSYDSKIEEMKNVKKAQGNMMEVGIGIVMILALIGIMNYVNTVTGNIQNRQVLMAMLESIGMTEKQMKQMLVIEGMLFAAGALFLTATLGLGVTYWIYESMNYQQIPFSVPLLPVAGMLVFIFAACMVIPLVTRNIVTKKGSVAERIRGFE